MKFYNREPELKLLEQTRLNSTNGAKMTVITGRRRIGKTSLILKSVEKTKHIYLFVSRKDEILLCRDFVLEIEQALGIQVYGEFKSFGRLFGWLAELSTNRQFTLIIDEIQEFENINPSVFSDMQQTWDRTKDRSGMNLVLSGSVYTLMKKIFENSKEPLFGRANERIHLKPFIPDILLQVIRENSPKAENIDMLVFYAITGGVAKYVELLADKGVFTIEAIANEIFRENSFWLDEGKSLLIEGFGKDYQTYFSILSLLAGSVNTRAEIEGILEKNVGGYIDRLINDYQLIKTIKPIFSKPGGRIQQIIIEDNFLNFWFRFIHKYRSAIEIGNYNYVKEIFLRDYRTWSGKFLEKWFMATMALSGNFTRIGTFWDRGDTGIDIVGLNELLKTAVIAEVKLNPDKFNQRNLENNAQKILPFLRGYKIDYQLMTLKDLIND